MHRDTIVCETIPDDVSEGAGGGGGREGSAQPEVGSAQATTESKLDGETLFFFPPFAL